MDTLMQYPANLSKGQQQMNQYEEYAWANKYNAAVLRKRAEQVGQTTNQREEQQRRQSRVALGEENARAGQSGTGFTGSNADIAHQNMVLMELDALNIRYEGKLQQDDIRSQADLEDWEGKINMQNRMFAYKQAALGAVAYTIGGMSKNSGYGSNTNKGSSSKNYSSTYDNEQ